MRLFKPWEVPTGGSKTPESETARVDSKALLAAKRAGIAAYQAPLDPDNDPDDRRRWYLHARKLDDGRMLYLEPMLPGHLSLAIAHDECTLERWCYHDHDAAWRAVLGWNGKGDPDGWYRHPLTGRRRPGGVAEDEYINASDLARGQR